MSGTKATMGRLMMVVRGADRRPVAMSFAAADSVARLTQRGRQCGPLRTQRLSRSTSVFALQCPLRDSAIRVPRLWDCNSSEGADAEGFVPILGRIEVAERGTCLRGVAAEAAAANDADRYGRDCATQSVAGTRWGSVVRVVYVATPLPDVSVCVVQAERIRAQRAHDRRLNVSCGLRCSRLRPLRRVTS